MKDKKLKYAQIIEITCRTWLISSPEGMTVLQENQTVHRAVLKDGVTLQ
jgi:hypothetical protein